MARSFAGLSTMAARFGYRLARARKASQHRGMPVRYLLEDKKGVTPFRNLEERVKKPRPPDTLPHIDVGSVGPMRC